MISPIGKLLNNPHLDETESSFSQPPRKAGWLRKCKAFFRVWRPHGQGRGVSIPGRPGFTLIELLLVVFLLSVIAVISLPHLSQSFFGLQLQNLTSEVAYLMRYARSRAITRQRDVQLVFDDEFTTYRLLETASDGGEDSEEQKDYQRISGRWGRTFTVPQEIRIEGTRSSIQFHPDGQMEKGRFTMCRDDDCMMVSTREQRGRILTFALSDEEEE